MSCEKIVVKELPEEIMEDGLYEINQTSPNSYTHEYFKYPCKFIPEIPRWAIKKYLKEECHKFVLDPFAGSGTTLLEALLLGHNAIGTEIDEVAKLITKVKTTQLSTDKMSFIEEWTNEVVGRLVDKSYKSDQVKYPKINNVEHWFNPISLSDLGHISYLISQIEDEDIKDFLQVCLASIIKKASNADDISPKPYVSNKVVKKIEPVSKLFETTVHKYLNDMRELNNVYIGKIQLAGDAKSIGFNDSYADLAVTSPPYINAFDYARIMRLENLWLEKEDETSIRNKKKDYLGTESIKIKVEQNDLDILKSSQSLGFYYSEIEKIDKKRALIVKKFFEDMLLNLKETCRVLKSGSKYVVVIGNSTIRGIEIESWKVLKEISIYAGFSYLTHFSYEIKNPYIRIPRGRKGGKISVDHVLVLEKGK